MTFPSITRLTRSSLEPRTGKIPGGKTWTQLSEEHPNSPSIIIHMFVFAFCHQFGNLKSPQSMETDETGERKGIAMCSRNGKNQEDKQTYANNDFDTSSTSFLHVLHCIYMAKSSFPCLKINGLAILVNLHGACRLLRQNKPAKPFRRLIQICRSPNITKPIRVAGICEDASSLGCGFSEFGESKIWPPPLIRTQKVSSTAMGCAILCWDVLGPSCQTSWADAERSSLQLVHTSPIE